MFKEVNYDYFTPTTSVLKFIYPRWDFVRFLFVK
jgi:hypothetical protein